MPMDGAVYKISASNYGVKLELNDKGSICWLGICDTEDKAKELYDLYLLYKLNPEAKDTELFNSKEYYKNLLKELKDSGKLTDIEDEADTIPEFQLLYEYKHKHRNPEAPNEAEPIIRLKRPASKSVDSENQPDIKRQAVGQEGAKSAPKP